MLAREWHYFRSVGPLARTICITTDADTGPFRMPTPERRPGGGGGECRALAQGELCQRRRCAVSDTVFSPAPEPGVPSSVKHGTGRVGWNISTGITRLSIPGLCMPGYCCVNSVMARLSILKLCIYQLIAVSIASLLGY